VLVPPDAGPDSPFASPAGVAATERSACGERSPGDPSPAGGS